MKERPILFSAPMVRAILEGRKTVTRRTVKSPAKNMQAAGMEVIKYRPPGDPWYKDHVWSMRGSMGVWGDYTHDAFMALCPHGIPGDRLWVRETWSPVERESDCVDGIKYRADGFFRPIENTRAAADLWMMAANSDHSGKWRPSIFMRRWMARITLEIASVRVERLHDITEEDARAEGVTTAVASESWSMMTRDGGCLSSGVEPSAETRAAFDVVHVQHVPAHQIASARDKFATLWRTINGVESWDANPWVWRIEFRRVA